MAPHSSSLAWKIPWTEEPVVHSPRGRKESDTTERPGSLKEMAGTSYPHHARNEERKLIYGTFHVCLPGYMTPANMADIIAANYVKECFKKISNR